MPRKRRKNLKKDKNSKKSKLIDSEQSSNHELDGIVIDSIDTDYLDYSQDEYHDRFISIEIDFCKENNNKNNNDKLKIFSKVISINESCQKTNDLDAFMEKWISNDHESTDKNNEEFKLVWIKENYLFLLNEESKSKIFLNEQDLDCLERWPKNTRNHSEFFSFQMYLTETTDSVINFCLDVYIYKKIIIDNHKYYENNHLQPNETVLSLMNFLFPNPYYDNDSCGLIENSEFSANSQINRFYDWIINEQTDYLSQFQYESPTINDSHLQTTLWTHQRQAIEWMLQRESGKYRNDASQLFVKYTFDNVTLYYNQALGHFITEDVYQKYIGKIQNTIRTGGILADEMGLGKTVDVIALILNNRRNDPVQNWPVLDLNQLFCLSENPIKGELQCHCNTGNRIITETLNLDELYNSCLQKNYHLNENFIKCLMCANYQHLECSDYNFDCIYLCSRCWTKVERIDTSTTLIVCPNSILKQWIAELQKHINPDLNIKILNYTGAQSRKYYSPASFAASDIVITTYQILRTELNFKPVHDYEHLRNSKRFYPIISQLSSINWWRICFDEAQLVEGKVSNILKMAQSLSAKHYWAITGTPIQKNVDDLFGLIKFIHEEPYSEISIWKNALYQPYCNNAPEYMIDVLKKCFWRRTKDSVLDEIKIPKPIVEMNTFDFSQIERDFYLNKAAKHRDIISNILSKFADDVKINELNNSTQTLIFNQVLNLRQICCHPEMTSNILNLKEHSSMNAVLKQMIEDAKYSCERIHRTKISSMNGIAAIQILEDRIPEAIKTYREALESISQYENIRTDKTQLYHIYCNLAQIMDFVGCQQVDSQNNPYPPFNELQNLPKFSGNVSKMNLNMEEDKFFRLKAKKMYDEYLNDGKLRCITSEKYLLHLNQQCTNLKKKLRIEHWFIFVMKNLPVYMELNEIIVSLSGILSSPNLMCQTLNEFTYKLETYLKSFEELHEEMESVFKAITIETLEKEANQCIKCHVKLEAQTHECLLCKPEKKMKKFEELMFNVVHGKINKSIHNKYLSIHGINQENNWNENNHLLALKKIASLFKTNAPKNDENLFVQNEINLFFEYFDACKKEFKAYRKYYIDCFEFVLRIDELKQASFRLNSFSYFEEETNKSLKDTCQEKLISALTKFKYLQNLQESLKNKDSVESRLCSVCWCDLDHYVILNCGHLICESCIVNLKNINNKITGTCPVCRTPFSYKNLNIVNTSLVLSPEKVVKGNCSTKMIRIIRCVMKINECNEKILIFSTWPQMLALMHNLLELNNIKSILINSFDTRFYDKILNFKKSDCSVLLLPIKFACKGLNLTEASHIIFINSIPNKTDELQAIGRIYRIGQTKQTYVHKFIIQDTIEQLIENNKQEFGVRKTTDEFSNLTIREFSNLFNVYGNQLDTI